MKRMPRRLFLSLLLASALPFGCKPDGDDLSAPIPPAASVPLVDLPDGTYEDICPYYHEL